MSSTVMTSDYEPSDEEMFMNEKMRGYFRHRLVEWRDGLLRESDQTLTNLQQESVQEADIGDRASKEADRSLELRTRDRGRKLISKIDEALGRLDDGSYGYCVETGDPINLRRLMARPIATLSIEAQERHERLEKTHKDS